MEFVWPNGLLASDDVGDDVGGEIEWYCSSFISAQCHAANAMEVIALHLLPCNAVGFLGIVVGKLV